MPFIKNLASSGMLRHVGARFIWPAGGCARNLADRLIIDRKVRASALASLHTFLSARQIASVLSPLDILKLWKGLFYALWMCDRAIPQQTLCAELADLIYILPRDAVVPWLRGFWATMSREWTSIDVLRMEKFLLLVRRVLGASFGWMKSGSGKGADKAWDAGRVGDILTLLNEWPFSTAEEAQLGDGPDQGHGAKSTQSIPAGLRLHVLDIWVDETEKVGLLEQGSEATEILQRLSEQVDILEQKTTSPAVRVRSKESLADHRLQTKAGQGESVGAEGTEMVDSGDGCSWDGFDD